jgi:hypothetical protein
MDEEITISMAICSFGYIDFYSLHTGRERTFSVVGQRRLGGSGYCRF